MSHAFHAADHDVRCRYRKATNSVQSRRFWVSYKHNGAYFTHSVTF